MRQRNPFVIHVLVGLVTVWGTAIIAPVTDAQTEPTFVDICEAFQGLSGQWSRGSSALYSRPYAWQTMEALMSSLNASSLSGSEISDSSLSGSEISDSSLSSEDCFAAEQTLASVEVLQGPQLQTAYLPENGLMVDFPVGVDLQMIAMATPNLTELNLTGRVISDLTPIAGLSKLQTLRLANTQLEDISPLSTLNQLTTLDISYNQIDDIAPIAEISTIRSLNVAYNPFTDVSPIGNILTPAVEPEWQLLDLSGINIDSVTCPDNLGDICGEGVE